MFLAFSAAQELAKAMGLESEFGATLLTELEGGDVSRDSLIVVFSELMTESEKYNSKEEMIHVHTAFLTKLYVEKIFITSSLLSQAQKKDEASAILEDAKIPASQEVTAIVKIISKIRTRIVSAS
ncbi:MAG: hypothetical protein PF450_02810 [Bacteroidales bacterium]|jgi:uncharacterized protein YciI|nr:hypothetical protein [Bacteroidales bacterium]